MKLPSKSTLTKPHHPLLGIFVLLLGGTVASAFKLPHRQNDNWPDDSEQVHDRAAIHDDEPMLLWSTKTDIFKISTGNIQTITASTQLDKVVTKNDYAIEMFDVSLKDRLALYGINKITAYPIAGGDNYMSINTEQSLPIKFDPKAFAVDWVDYNVYAYYEKKLYIYKLSSATTSALIYNGTQTLRNIMVEHRNHFIAWIGNDHNIVKANKDGSGVATVHTTKDKIECMAIDSSSSRFFFFVMQKVAQTYRSAYDDYGGDGDANDGSNDYDNSYGEGNKYAVLYSIDFKAESPLVNEMQVRMDKKGAVPVQFARYKSSTYMIREYEIAAHGKKNELGVPDKNNKFKKIYAEQNWQINNVQVVGPINVAKDLCNKSNNCGYAICVHMTDDQANCIDSNGQVLPMTTATTKKNTDSTTQLQGLIFGSGQWKTWAIVAVFVVISIVLVYFVYTYYIAEPKVEDKLANQNGEGGQEGTQGAGGVTGSKIEGSLKSGQLPAAAAAAAPKEKGFYQMIMSWLGFGSEEDEQQQEVTEQTGLEKTGMSQLGQKSNKLPSLVRAPSNAPKSQVGEMAAKAIGSKGEGLKEEGRGDQTEKKKLSVKQRQRSKDRKSLYETLEKTLDTDQEDKLAKSANKRKKAPTNAAAILPSTESTTGESSTPKSAIKKESSFRKNKSRSASKTGRKSKTTPDENSTQTSKSKSVTGSKNAKSKKSKKRQNKIGSLVMAPLCSSGSEHDSSSNGGSKLEPKASRAKSKAKSRTSSISSQTGGSRKSKADKDPSGDVSTGSKSTSDSSSMATKAMTGLKSMASSLFGSTIDSTGSSAMDGTKNYKWYDPLGCCT